MEINYKTDDELAIETMAIRKIENFGARYDPDSVLSLGDQLLICETIAESTLINEPIRVKENITSESVFSDNASVSGACYSGVNFSLIKNFDVAINKLKHCSSASAPFDVAQVIEETLGEPGKQGHWLWIAQHYNPRPIVWVFKEMNKRIIRGDVSLQNPRGYFTYLIKHRKPKSAFKKRRVSVENRAYQSPK